MVTTRKATVEDVPAILAYMNAAPHAKVNFTEAWVSEEGGKIIAVLTGRLVWQLEPLIVTGESTNVITNSRGALGVYKAAQEWIEDPKRNPTTIRWFFCVTRSEAVKRWAIRLGWAKTYEGATTFVKFP